MTKLSVDINCAARVDGVLIKILYYPRLDL